MKLVVMITGGTAATLAAVLAGCSHHDGAVSVGNAAVAPAGVPSGIGAVLTDASPPVVKSVALGNVNGVSLGIGGTTGWAQATKDGSSYKISGTASGMDMSNPMAGPVNKSFELDVTCPQPPIRSSRGPAGLLTATQPI